MEFFTARAITRCIVSLLVLSSSAIPFTVFAEDALPEIHSTLRDIKTDRHFQQLINDSSQIYRTVIDGEQGKVPAAVMKNARCVVVIPNVVTGALVFGGAYGDGIASCKTKTGSWSMPAPISLTEGSIGIQAGTKTADLVLFLQTPEAVQQLKVGNLSFGRAFSAVAGKYDRTFDSSNANVVVYSRSNGIFAGASIAGSKIVKDDECIKKFYGDGATYLSLLDGKNATDDNSIYKAFTSLLPS